MGRVLCGCSSSSATLGWASLYIAGSRISLRFSSYQPRRRLPSANKGRSVLVQHFQVSPYSRFKLPSLCYTIALSTKWIREWTTCSTYKQYSRIPRSITYNHSTLYSDNHRLKNLSSLIIRPSSETRCQSLPQYGPVDPILRGHLSVLPFLDGNPPSVDTYIQEQHEWVRTRTSLERGTSDLLVHIARIEHWDHIAAVEDPWEAHLLTAT
jgi:hypothetical protein